MADTLDTTNDLLTALVAQHQKQTDTLNKLLSVTRFGPSAVGDEDRDQRARLLLSPLRWHRPMGRGTMLRTARSIRHWAGLRVAVRRDRMRLRLSTTVFAIMEHTIA